MASRPLRVLVWVSAMVLPVVLVGSLYVTARAATARRTGGPLWFSEQGSGSVNQAQPDLWIGCGFANNSARPVRISSVEVIPVCVLSPDVTVSELFLTNLPIGCPPVNDDPRTKGVQAYEAAGFVIPARETRGAFLHLHLEGSGLAGTNVYRLRIVYVCGALTRVLEPYQFLTVYASGR